VEAVFERDGRVYLIADVAPVTPRDEEIAEFAFSKAVTDQAPNPNIKWFRGQYVEADNPNLNGAMWPSNELAIASVTPMLMPVTVMHDPRTAVGLIADIALRTREKDNVPRSRLDNVLALWGHRFPEAVEEAQANYEAGTLMQSMECLPSYYDCGSCGKSYPKLPGGAEKANWCGHLRDEHASRIMRNVTFTGTGLIFGSRGAKGAYSEAHLEPLMDEVAEFHERARHDEAGSTRPKPKPTPRRKNRMEIEDTRYQELLAAESKLKDLEPKLSEAQETAAKVPDLERKVETLEVEKKAAADEAAAEKTKREGLEEQARATELASERVSKLGKTFREKLPESIRTKLDEQAKTLKDDEWTARLDELAELVGVKADEGGPAGSGEGSGSGAGSGEFSREEVARAGLSSGASGGGGGGAISPERRRSVVAGLVKPPTGASK